MSETKTCKNCERSFDETYAFCPYCGQKAKDQLTIGVLFSNTIANYFSVDARFFKSFVPLVLKPGYLARQFVEGRRLTYLHPAQFYLFISVVFFFLFSIVSREQQRKFDEAFNRSFERRADSLKISGSDPGLQFNFGSDTLSPQESKQVKERSNEAIKEFLNAEDSIQDKQLKRLSTDILRNNVGKWQKKMDSLLESGAPVDKKLEHFGIEAESGTVFRFIGKQLIKIYERRFGGLLKTFYDSVPIALFFLLPLFALLLKIFYWRRATFAHNMVFSFYYFTFMFLVFTFLVICDLLFGLPGWLDWLIIFSTIIYLFLSLRQFYRQGWFLSFIKTGLISFAYMTVVLPISVFLMLILSFLLY